MSEILRANSIDELKQALKLLDIDVPRLSAGRKTPHPERYSIAHLLSTIPHCRLSFPLGLTHGDKPDFVLAMPSFNVGIEHTEAVPENGAHAQSLREKGFGSELYLIHHASPGEARKSKTQLLDELQKNNSGDGWVGDSPEMEWAEALAYFVSKKIAKAAACQRHAENWLLVYDNWPLPSVKIAKAIAFLAPKLNDLTAFETFDCVFVLDSSHLCEFRLSSAKYWSICLP